MTALEQALRRALQCEPLWIPEPYGPDVTVFGPRQPERDEPDYPALRTCPRHDVRWGGDGKCWCCVAGIPGVTA